MEKPDFKRKEQAQGFDGKAGGGLLAKFRKKTYQWRWWVLEDASDQRLSTDLCLRYYRDQNSPEESGHVEMKHVTSCTVSTVADAPLFALDLNTAERRYTVASDTQEEMVKWAALFKQIAAGKYKPDDGEERHEGEVHKGEEFTVEFTNEESLFMSLEGLSTYTIIVTGFVRRPDGSQGQAEESGKIHVDDYLIGVNDTNLEQLTFFDSVSEIQAAAFPKTLHFRRTAADEHEELEQKGWVLARDPASEKFYRRFLQLMGSELSYFKPAYGGRQSERAGFIDLTQLADVTQAHDMRATEKLQVQMVLNLKNGDHWMVCVRDLAELAAWAGVLAKERGGNTPVVAPLESREATAEERLAGAAHSGELQKQSDLNSAIFAQRFFVLRGSELSYFMEPKSRKLATVDLSQVSSLQPLKVTGAPPGTEHRLRLVHASKGEGDVEQRLTIATGDEAALAAWNERLADALTTLGGSAELKALETIEQEAPPAAGEGDDEGDDDDDADEGNEVVKTDFSQFGSQTAKVQGWMHKKGDVSGPLGIKNTTFKRRYFVLNQTELCYYRTHAQSLDGTPTGVVRLRTVKTVAWSGTTWAENAIDLITNKRKYTIAPETDAEASNWMDALSEAVDMLAGTADDSTLPPDEDAAAEKLREEIKSSLAKAGNLTKLTGNKLSGIDTWKERYFALSGAVLSYYLKEEDLYNEDADARGTISMAKATKIVSSEHPETKAGVACDVTVGERTHVFIAASADECTAWMIAIAAATGRLEMRQKDGGTGTWESWNPRAKLTQRMSTYGNGAAARAKGGGRRSTTTRSSGVGGAAGGGAKGGRGRGRGAAKRASMARASLVRQQMDITAMPEAEKLADDEEGGETEGGGAGAAAAPAPPAADGAGADETKE